MDIEEISIEDFKAIPQPSRTQLPERVIIEAMTPGTALILTHVKPCKGRGRCTVLSRLGALRKKHSDRRWSGRHTEDGRVAVACFPKENP